MMPAREAWREAFRRIRRYDPTPEPPEVAAMFLRACYSASSYPKDPLRRPLMKRLAWFRSSRTGPDPGMPF